MKSTTWRNIGTEVDGVTVEEVLNNSGLNYNVVKEPIFLANGTKLGVQIPGKYATKVEGTDNVFGVVGNEYEIIQNIEAFDFINNLVKKGLRFEKAGQTAWGMIYIIASFPEYKIFGDDIRTYIIFQNSHNGWTALKAAICPLRVACENQFAMAFKTAQNSISIRHTVSAATKLEEAKHVMKETLGYTDEFKKLAKELVQIKIPQVTEQRILEAVFPLDEKASNIKRERVELDRKSVSNLYHEEDDLQNLKGNAWGFLNAYSDYITHKEPVRKAENWEENRFFQSMRTNEMDKFLRIVRAS